MTYEEFRRQFHIRLNGQQSEAVQRVDGPVLLLAVPGSGKTTVLVARLGYLIHCAQVPPESILTLTYTVAATRDMWARFASCFGEEMSARMEFRTINGVCAKVIQYYGQLIGKRSFSLVTEEKGTAGLLSSVYQRIEGGYATEGDLKNIRTAITYIKNMMLDGEGIRELEESADYRIGEIYRAYCSELRAQGLMDYDDQMLYAHAILRKSPETLGYFRRRYPYICVDEAQDTSRIQHAIIRLLAGDRDNLFMVGDEDQSIYGFRAAYPRALLAFEEEHPGGEVLLMEENFRSNARIVEAADTFIRKNVLRRQKHMKAVREAGTDIREIDLKSRGAQYPYLAKVARGCRVRTAVLYRDNESALPLVDLLEREGIPYRIRNAELTFFTHRLVQDIRDIICFAENPADTELFLQIYYKISTYLNKQAALRACEISREKGTAVLDAAVSLGSLPEGTARSCRALRMQLKGLLSERAHVALDRIVREMGYGDYLKRMGMGDGKLFLLREIAQNEATLLGLVERLSVLRRVIEEKEFDRDCPFVLSTIHASKGLEYDRVYLMDVADGIFPESIPEALAGMGGRSGSGDRTERKGRGGNLGADGSGPRGKVSSAEEEEQQAYEEERRLFYVGITRAKEELSVFGFRQKSIFRQELFAQMKYRKFCDAIGEGLVVRHKRLGEGVVMEAGEYQAVIVFGGRPRRLDLRTLYENDLLVL